MSKLIELIKKYEKSNDYEAAFWDVVSWNACSGKDKDPEAVAKQYMWVEEEFYEILSAENGNDLIDAYADVFITAAQQYYNQFKSYPDYKIQIDSVSHALDLMQDAIELNQHWRIYLLIEAVLDRCNFDVMGVLTEVSNSNWSKFPNFKEFGEDEEYCKLECERIEKEGRYSGVHYSLVLVDGETKVVFFDENRKILKAFTFVEPNLSKFV